MLDQLVKAFNKVPFKSIFLICSLLCFFISDLEAQRAQRRRIGKRFSTTVSSIDISTYDFSVGDEFDRILTTSSDTDLYDPLTIANLRKLKEDAVPPWDPLDIDPERTRKVVEKAFAIQSARSLIKLINQSEIKPVYALFKNTVKNFSDLFRYSVQDRGDELTVSKSKQGDKLIELNLEFNLKQGVDPQINVGDSFRLRYDYTTKRSLFEYGVDF